MGEIQWHFFRLNLNRIVNMYDDAAKMILFWIELYRRRLPGFDIDALEYSRKKLC